MWSGIPYDLRILHTDGLCTQSKALRKSMKFISSFVSIVVTFSTICLSVKICSQHDLPFLKPACCWRSMLSIAALILSRMMPAIIFPGTDSNVIPLQLLQSFRSPFLGSGIMIPSFQSLGTCPNFHTWLHSLVSLVSNSSPPCFNNSACIPSTPGDFPFFILFITRSTSSAVISPSSMSSSSTSTLPKSWGLSEEQTLVQITTWLWQH